MQYGARFGRDDVIGAPRVAALGRPRTSLGAGAPELINALRETCDLRLFDVPRGPQGWVRAIREGGCAVRRDGCEVVHLFDPSLALVGLWLKKRFGVEVGISLDGARGKGRGLFGVIDRLDAAFVSDLDRARDLVVVLKRAQVSYAPPGSVTPAEPEARTLKSYQRMLRRAGAGRLSIGVMWPADREHMRWFRDAVMPLLHGDPTCVLIGAPNVREARMIFGGRAKQVRSRSVRITSEEVAAAARFVDVFVVPGGMLRARSQIETLLALIASGVPMVAGGAVRDAVLEHEANALLVDPADAMGLASTLNQLLTLPALQRHYLGKDFAARALAAQTWQRAAEVYGERFAALVGRPRIPLELKAA